MLVLASYLANGIIAIAEILGDKEGYIGDMEYLPSAYDVQDKQITLRISFSLPSELLNVLFHLVQSRYTVSFPSLLSGVLCKSCTLDKCYYNYSLGK